ncbi:MAG: putative rane protein [Naasia sp.]|nr:putative rane protein [Naasia sp.]
MTSISDLPVSTVEENTLGAVPGTHRKRNLPSLRLPSFASSRIIDENAGSLGAGFLGIGAMIVCVIVSVYELTRFTFQWSEYPVPVAAAVAWLLYAALLVGVGVVIRRNDDRLPDRMFLTFVSGLGVVILLDLVAVWGAGDVAGDVTAGIAAGVGLLAVVGVRPTRQIFLAAAGVGGLLLLADIFDGNVDIERLVPSILMLARATAPALLGALILRAFRRMVKLELDRVLVQSTVSAPRYAVGMLASEELARLDLAAEQLLEGVAGGRTPLPLSPKGAQTAASLATELRLHLIEGRRETWLYHAISESELLGPTVSLRDPGSLAGLLDPRQRDGLLSTIWLLVSDDVPRESGSRRTATITLGPVTAPSTGVGRKIRIPILIETFGVARGKVDAAAWDAIRKVGRHTDSVRDGSLCLEIECLVDSPADS